MPRKQGKGEAALVSGCGGGMSRLGFDLDAEMVT